MTDQEFLNSLFPKTSMSEGEILLSMIDTIDENREEWITECEQRDKQYLASLN